MAHPGGRPPIYKTPEAMQEAVDEYFDRCPDKRNIRVRQGKENVEISVPCPTMTWLALWLWFVNRQSMYDYENIPEFSDIVKKARSRIEREYEANLQNANSTGSIFALKNFGWIDKQQTEFSGDVTIKSILNDIVS